MICKVPIYFDLSLRRFEDIYVPVGCPRKILRIPVDRLARMVGAQWIDVSRPARVVDETIEIAPRDYILV
ncbi:hypothetical protein Aam_051_011 [Acidocella aminolytica 101 = DSM 11237]|uniref:Uncharacterized protein n=1 Tax=Acidocella aminolytica 101 = DSM 11237 TaxID=1120923 RepID=A0A0D6PFT6_9PROT|nr:hypothetical protein Aam_051_011 [Acidocella aminolytica 101 = DSM 11237]GBQ43031.1 hypothetical protein AA11237_3152 [Acidocella aminolytica 101 = DSM 11237]